jgi:hypothetical protein
VEDWCPVFYPAEARREVAPELVADSEVTDNRAVGDIRSRGGYWEFSTTRWRSEPRCFLGDANDQFRIQPVQLIALTDAPFQHAGTSEGSRRDSNRSLHPQQPARLFSDGRTLPAFDIRTSRPLSRTELVEIRMTVHAAIWEGRPASAAHRWLVVEPRQEPKLAVLDPHRVPGGAGTAFLPPDFLYLEPSQNKVHGAFRAILPRLSVI